MNGGGGLTHSGGCKNLFLSPVTVFRNEYFPSDSAVVAAALAISI